MKLKFKKQAYQTLAVESVVDCFKGRPNTTGISYRIDPVKQAIADSWPDCLEDYAARVEWGWKPTYDLARMTTDMLKTIGERMAKKGG